MSDMSKRTPPWASGPGEILRHGLALLRNDTDTNRRLAMIAIDNAVELMVKTFLGLPRRVTSITISRKAFAEISESFPSLLDALETHASARLAGVDLGEIEWYHRLRNELYHEGNGLTVERDKVEVYAELANVLFKNLFGVELVPDEDDSSQSLGRFLAAWVDLERFLVEASQRFRVTSARIAHDMMSGAQALARKGRIGKEDIAELDSLRRIRNDVVHGVADHRTVLTPQVVDKVRSLRDRIGRATEAA
jgi:hypothetical protein